MKKNIITLCTTVLLLVLVVVLIIQNISLMQSVKSLQEMNKSSDDHGTTAPSESETTGAPSNNTTVGGTGSENPSGNISNNEELWTMLQAAIETLPAEEKLNLEGMIARSLGVNSFNQIVRMKNGSLTLANTLQYDAETKAASIYAFDQYLQELDIDFTYIQAPHKDDLTGTNMPVGIVNNGNQHADSLLAELGAYGIDTLDLRPLLAKDPETAAKYFYNTDHHWNNDAAFVTFGEILSLLNEKFPTAGIDLSYADIANWETTIYEDQFLGSHGKKVGIHFGGVDDYKYYAPKFETDMYMTSMQNRVIFRTGTFEEAVALKEVYLEKEPDYFKENTYCSYIGGDYAVIKHRNRLVENGPKVMIIKDSFTIPVQAFLSTAISELDVVDPRHFKNCTLAQYVEMTRPDIVIMMINPSTMYGTSYYDFGIDEARATQAMTEAVTIAQKDNLELSANSTNNSCHTTVAADLQYGSKYTLKFDSATILDGTTEAIAFALFNGSELLIYENIYIDPQNTNGYEWEFVTPTTGEGELSLLMYAGLFGSTAGNHVLVEGIVCNEMTEP